MKYFVLLVILLLPLSPAFGYEYYEKYGWLKIEKDPTFCFISWNDEELDSHFYDLTEQGINAWSVKLKEYTNNQDAWNIYLKNISSLDEEDSCDGFIGFSDEYIGGMKEVLGLLEYLKNMRNQLS